MNIDINSVFERRKVFYLSLTLFMVMILLMLISLRSPIDYDSYWHIKMGEDIYEHGYTPYVDRYSYTHAGEKIRNPPVMFQILSYLSVKCCGEWWGFLLVKLLAYSCLVLSAFGLLSANRVPVIQSVFYLSVLSFLVVTRSQLRPELFSYCLIVISLIFVERARRSDSYYHYMILAIILLLWVNYHSAIFAYVVMLVPFVDKLINQYFYKRNQQTGFSVSTVFSALTFGLLFIFLGFVNPSASHPLIEAINFPREWRGLIAEYVSSYSIFKGYLTYYVPILVAGLSLWLCFRYALYGYMLCILISLLGYFSYVRLVAPCGIIIITCHIIVMENIKRELRLHSLFSTNSRCNYISMWLYVIVGFVALVESSRYVREELKNNFSYQYLLPDNMVSYMIEKQLKGNVFNSYHLGGYLLYKLYPNISVYIDGRTGILYPIEHMMHYDTLLQDGKKLRKDIDLYDINYAVLEHAEYSDWDILVSERMYLDYVDLNHSLYVDENPNLMHAGFLAARPYCLHMHDKDTLANEYDYSLKYMPEGSYIIHYLNLAISILEGTQSIEDLRRLLEQAPYSKSIRMLSGHALQIGEYEHAVQLLSSLQYKDLKDYLSLSVAYIFTNRNDRAAYYLDEALKRLWPRIELSDIQLITKLVAALGGNGENSRYYDYPLVRENANVASDGYSLDDLFTAESIATCVYIQ